MVNSSLSRSLVVIAVTLSDSVQAPKKDQKDEDEEDKAFKAKQKADAAAMKDAKDKGLSPYSFVQMHSSSLCSNQRYSIVLMLAAEVHNHLQDGHQGVESRSKSITLLSLETDPPADQARSSLGYSHSHILLSLCPHIFPPI